MTVTDALKAAAVVITLTSAQDVFDLHQGRQQYAEVDGSAIQDPGAMSVEALSSA
jgi:hypothetical protein